MGCENAPDPHRDPYGERPGKDRKAPERILRCLLPLSHLLCLKTAQEQKQLASITISKIYFPNGGFQNYISTWPALCDDFLKRDDFGKYIKNSEKAGKKLLPTLDLANKSQLEQAIEITQYVKTMYKWDETNGKFATDNF